MTETLLRLILTATLATNGIAQLRPSPPGGQILDGQTLLSGDIVKDAPFSGKGVTEVHQILSDGNEIDQSAPFSMARDSAGRMRREGIAVPIGALGLLAAPPIVPPASKQAFSPLILISDPVEGLTYTLIPPQKLAFRRRALTGQMPSLPTPTQSGVVVEQLGVREIAGVRVNGTLTTTTIAAGTVGNKAPIAIVIERWYSSELQLPVSVRFHDPRSGETTFRFTEIRRQEPPPDGFHVPADYTVRDAPIFRR